MTKTVNSASPFKSLRDKAMMVKFQDSVWGGQRRDRAVTADVATRYETKKTKVGYYNKFLVPKDRLEKRIQTGLDARRFHNTNTLPWLDDGVRILPSANYQDYISGMRKRASAALAAEREIYENWDDIVKEGMMLLGKMARLEDYPSLDDIKTRFSFEVIVLPLPEVADWRVDIPKKDLALLQKQAEQTLAAVQQDGLLELAQRLLAVVEHCHTRLSDPESTFRDSLFENIRKMVVLLPKLNLVNDPQLEAIRKEVEEKLGKQVAAEVREDPGMRSKTAKDAAAIMKKMNAYMQQ